MPLHTTHRPTKLDDIVGNESTVESLRSVLGREDDRPHSFLFTGPAGSGKTTTARILKNELNCSDSDLYLYNGANSRGIDTIREIVTNSNFAPMFGEVKLIVIEECFSKDTEITMHDDSKKYIQDIVIGDKIKNLNGIDEVEQTFINKVPLERVVKIHLDNGKKITCSKDHLFLTDSENDIWTKAKDLDSQSFLCYRGNKVANTLLQGESGNGKEKICEDMQRMQERFHVGKEKRPILFKQLLKEIQGQGTSNVVQKAMQTMWKRVRKQSTKCSILPRVQNKATNDLRGMWEGIPWHSFKGITLLFSSLRWKMEKYAARFSKDAPFRESCYCGNGGAQTFSNGKQGKIFRTDKGKFGEDEKNKSHVRQENSRKNVTDKTYEWYITCMEWCSWWKWSIYRSSKVIVPSTALAYGDSGIIRKKETWLSNKLQDRYCKQAIENRGGGGWEKPSMACKENKRQEKGEKISRVGVENIEIYKRGDNERSFQSSIGDTERSQGFVNLYDFQVKNNPSYIANGCYVHNCHQLTVPAQESLLVILEEPPKHIYFALCTTEPAKLKKSLKRRCHSYEFAVLTPIQIKKLLKDILEKEGVKDFPKEVIEKIADVCDGSPGKALNLLDTVIDVTDDKTALDAVENATITEANIAEIVRLLLSGRAQWSEIATLIKGLSGEPESLRYAFLGYFNAVLLDKGTDRVAEMMMAFQESVMYSGRGGLTLAIYFAYKAATA